MTLILGRPRPSKTLVRMVEARVSAGFPSPADDYAETYLSLDELVNVRAPSVYLVRASGDSLTGVGIFDGDVLVVDRAAVASRGNVVTWNSWAGRYAPGYCVRSAYRSVWA